MKKIHILTLFVLTCGAIWPLHGQSKKKSTAKDGHEIIFNIKDAQDSVVYLAIHYRDRLILKDSARNEGRGKFIFKGDNKYDEGLYILASQTRTPYLSFILDGSHFFTYNLDTTGNVDHFSVLNSPQNAIMLAFQQKTVKAQKDAQHYHSKKKEFEAQNKKDSVDFYNEKIKELNMEMTNYIQNLINENPDYLFSKLQKSYQAIEVPDPPVRADGSIDSNFQAVYYYTHFWDNVDLTDNRFIFLPVYENLFNEYFKKLLYYQEADTIIKYVDLFLSKIEGDSLMYRFNLERLTYEFESSKIIGHDAVFVHIAKNNQLNGKTPWIEEHMLSKYQKRIDNLEPLLIGKKAPELIMTDTSGKVLYSTYRTNKDYVILWFYDPTCGTCKKENAKLKPLYDSLSKAGTLNFEVYAVGNDEDTERWKKYVRDNGYNWINVGGFTANIDYLRAFNLIETGNPAMFILDKDHTIILNRRIDVENIPMFLEQHEKMKEYNKRKK